MKGYVICYSVFFNATQMFKLLDKYRPESAVAKKERLQKRAEEVAAGKPDVPTKKNRHLIHGINHITKLVESKRAQLVMIANDVDPIELVLWLPALCRKMGVPYCIVKCKARLGTVVRRKTTCALALTGVESQDRTTLNKIIEVVKNNYNERFDEQRKQWGGSLLSQKSMDKASKIKKAKDAELAKKQQ